MLSEREKDEAQKKMEAWMKVGKLAEQALAIMVKADVGPMEQAQLMWLVEKAEVQARLWNVGGE